DTSEAVAWATFYRSVLEERGVVILLPEDLAEAAELTVLSPGETYGTLTVFPEGRRIEGVGPRDVVIASSAPGELDLVAGLITTLPQNEFSHGNLRFLEMGVPNAVVPDIRDWPEVEALDGSLVRLVA